MVSKEEATSARRPVSAPTSKQMRSNYVGGQAGGEMVSKTPKLRLFAPLVYISVMALSGTLLRKKPRLMAYTFGGTLTTAVLHGFYVIADSD